MHRTSGTDLNTVLQSFAYSLDYLRGQVADVSSSDMVAQPGGISNHPAWTIGHLTHILRMVGAVVGLEDWLPEDWAGRYGSGSVPASDVERYESKDQLLSMLSGAQARIVRLVETLDEAQLSAPFPDPAYGEVFPTIRHFLTQVLVGHTAFHVGQVSVWRKAMGLPLMTQSYE